MSGAFVAEGGLAAGQIVARLRELTGAATALVLGDDADRLAAAAAARPDRAVILDGPGLAGGVGSDLAACALAEACAARGIEVLILPSSTRWREVAARLAIMTDGSCVTDALAVRRDEDGALLADRLLYGGLAVATVRLQRRPSSAPRSPAAGHWPRTWAGYRLIDRSA